MTMEEKARRDTAAAAREDEGGGTWRDRDGFAADTFAAALDAVAADNGSSSSSAR